MSRAKRRPLRRPSLFLLVPFVAGLLVAEAWRLPSVGFLFWNALAIVAAGALSLLQGRALAGPVMVCISGAFLSGAAASGVAAGESGPLTLRHAAASGLACRWDGLAVRASGWLRADTRSTLDGYRFDLQVRRIEIRGRTLTLAGCLEVDVDSGYGDPATKGQPAEKTAPRAGDTVEIVGTFRFPAGPGNPGEIPRARRLFWRGYQGHVSAKTAELVRVRGAETRCAGWRLLAAVRRRLIAPIREGWSGEEKKARGGLLEAFLFGGVADVPPDILQVFRDSGLSHVVAISGLQVVLAAAIARAAFRLAGAPPRACDLLAIASTGLYALLAGAEASVLRAAAGTAIYFLSRVAGRRVDRFALLGLVAVFLLAARPGLIHDAGFQLSFAATGGLIAIPATLLRDGARLRCAALRQPALSLLVSGIAAQLLTLPIVAIRFGRVSFYPVAANLVAVPIGSAIVACGGILAISGAIWPPLAHPLVPLLDGLLRALVAICRAGPVSPPVMMRVLPPTAAIVAIYYISLAAARSAPSPRSRSAAVSIFVLVAARLVCGPAILPPASPLLALDVIDVGQGDALLVRTTAGGSLLIDAGPIVFGRDNRGEPRTGERSVPAAVRYDAGESIVIPALRRLGLRRLDAVLVTHPHSDHAGGMEAILRDFAPGRLYIAAREHAPMTRRLTDIALRAGVIPIGLECGDVIDLGAGTTARVLHPDLQAAASDDPNARSVVLRIVNGRCAWLLTGDVDAAGQRRIASSGSPLRADLLKVPHHGSDKSFDERFLEASGALAGFVCVGRTNPWGHPGAGTLDRLRRGGLRVFRTDQDGALQARTDGKILTAGPACLMEPLLVRAARGGAPRTEGSVRSVSPRPVTLGRPPL